MVSAAVQYGVQGFDTEQDSWTVRACVPRKQTRCGRMAELFHVQIKPAHWSFNTVSVGHALSHHVKCQLCRVPTFNF